MSSTWGLFPRFTCGGVNAIGIGRKPVLETGLCVCVCDLNNDSVVEVAVGVAYLLNKSLEPFTAWFLGVDHNVLDIPELAGIDAWFVLSFHSSLLRLWGKYCQNWKRINIDI